MEIKRLENQNRKLSKDIEDLENQNKKLKKDLKKYNDKNKEMLNSTSWKVTKPLRVLKK